MRGKLKPLNEQVMVITGASSGIGLTTARAAAREGVSLVLASRNLPVLERVAAEINDAGGTAIAVECDVSDLMAVNRLGERAREKYGRIDTWVNNAGVSVIGEVIRTPIADHRRVFETNYWGVVNGCMVAIHHLREHGGALINVGSALSDRAIPLQGAYAASKHAVKGITDALRMEVEHEKLPISVTLVQPASIATPFEQHARAYTETEPKLPAPVYAPELVARAILRASTQPVRSTYVGGAARALAAISKTSPALVDRFMEGRLFQAQQTDRPRELHKDNLFSAGEDGQERSTLPRRVLERSMTDRVAEKPMRTLLFGAAIVLGVALLARGL
jgi:short-subunit dehydrogenase